VSADELAFRQLSSSLEQCAHCLQLYRYEWQRYCSACDGPVCPFCVTRIETRWICFGCNDEGDSVDRTRDVES
jgi:hypothetical protein